MSRYYAEDEFEGGGEKELYQECAELLLLANKRIDGEILAKMLECLNLELNDYFAEEAIESIVSNHLAKLPYDIIALLTSADAEVKEEEIIKILSLLGAEADEERISKLCAFWECEKENENKGINAENMDYTHEFDRLEEVMEALIFEGQSKIQISDKEDIAFAFAAISALDSFNFNKHTISTLLKEVHIEPNEERVNGLLDSFFSIALKKAANILRIARVEISEENVLRLIDSISPDAYTRGRMVRLLESSL
ncbi:MAG: hypothetical protein QXL16_01800 [Candidatus Micrarchaeaceae archaeon]